MPGNKHPDEFFDTFAILQAFGTKAAGVTDIGPALCRLRRCPAPYPGGGRSEGKAIIDRDGLGLIRPAASDFSLCKRHFRTWRHRRWWTIKEPGQAESKHEVSKYKQNEREREEAVEHDEAFFVYFNYGRG